MEFCSARDFRLGLWPWPASSGWGSTRRSATTSATEGFGKTPDDAVLTVAVSPRIGVTKQASDALSFSGSWVDRLRREPDGLHHRFAGRERVLGSTRVRPRVDFGVALPFFEKKFRPNDRAPDSLVRGKIHRAAFRRTPS